MNQHYYSPFLSSKKAKGALREEETCKHIRGLWRDKRSFGRNTNRIRPIFLAFFLVSEVDAHKALAMDLTDREPPPLVFTIFAQEWERNCQDRNSKKRKKVTVEEKSPKQSEYTGTNNGDLIFYLIDN